MAKKKMWTALCLAAVFCLAGCQSGGTDVSGETGEVQTEAAENSDGESEDSGQQADDSITGQVTSINGNEITLELIEMSQDVEMPEGETFAEGEAPEMPEGETFAEGEQPEMPEGETFAEGEEPSGGRGGNGRGSGSMTATGEEQTIIVSDETTYTIDEMGETQEASLDDIEEGDMLRVEIDGDTVVSVTIMNMGQGGADIPESGTDDTEDGTETDDAA